MKRRLCAMLAAAALTIGGASVAAAPAAAHARCDGKTHTHYYWTGRTAVWHHTGYVKARYRWQPDITWAYARSSDGQTHANACYW